MLLEKHPGSGFPVRKCALHLKLKPECAAAKLASISGSKADR